MLIKRSHTMPTHPGQMAFFGGHKQANEVHPFTVAMREFEEESSLSASNIRCLGLMGPVFTARKQAIIPVIAELNMDHSDFLKTAVSNGEWSDLIAVPWTCLNRPEFWSHATIYGQTSSSILFKPIAAGTYSHFQERDDAEFLLWGATARMVWKYLALYYQSQGRLNAPT